jgi:hypothetical protein
MDSVEIRQAQALEGALLCLAAGTALAFMLSMTGCGTSTGGPGTAQRGSGQGDFIVTIDKMLGK